MLSGHATCQPFSFVCQPLSLPAGIPHGKAMGSVIPFAVLGPGPPDLKISNFSRADSLFPSCLVPSFVSVSHVSFCIQLEVRNDGTPTSKKEN